VARRLQEGALGVSGFHVAPLRLADRARWLELWFGYLEFYGATLDPRTHDATWTRILDDTSPILGLGLRVGGADGELAGIAHAVFHETTWAVGPVCYLSDLFVDPALRGKGAARELIGALAQIARDRGCSRYYWLTHEDNARARILYDQVAANLGFIEYEHTL
jgi:GNAT superfamily N-acetyltransferase